jgi:hypothetical protein
MRQIFHPIVGFDVLILEYFGLQERFEDVEDASLMVL